MALIHFLSEQLDSKKSIDSLEVPELISILENFEEEEIKINKKTNLKINKIIEAINKLNLKGIPLLVKFIDILKEYGYWQDSYPIIVLTKRYGTQVLDIYVKHDPEAPAFIRKGVDF